MKTSYFIGGGVLRLKTIIIFGMVLVLCFSLPVFILASEKNSNLKENNNAINIENDQEIMKFKKELEEQNKEDNSEIIGSTLYYLNGKKTDIRTKETNLGNLIADSILANVKADLVFINSKGIKSSINKGWISKGDVHKVLPSKDKIIIKKIKGAALLQVIEHSLSRYPDGEGLFPQVSGIRIIFSQEEIEQHRILRVTVNGEPLKKDQYYLIATNDFLADGGDGFEILSQTEIVKKVGRLDKIFIDYLRKQGIIKAKTEGRIIGVSKEKKHFAYRVQKGDNLSLIARRFSTSIDKIVELNDLKNKNLIYSGQKLLIPGL